MAAWAVTSDPPHIGTARPLAWLTLPGFRACTEQKSTPIQLRNRCKKKNTPISI